MHNYEEDDEDDDEEDEQVEKEKRARRIKNRKRQRRNEFDEPRMKFNDKKPTRLRVRRSFVIQDDEELDDLDDFFRE